MGMLAAAAQMPVAQIQVVAAAAAARIELSAAVAVGGDSFGTVLGQVTVVRVVASALQIPAEATAMSAFMNA